MAPDTEVSIYTPRNLHRSVECLAANDLLQVTEKMQLTPLGRVARRPAACGLTIWSSCPVCGWKHHLLWRWWDTFWPPRDSKNKTNWTKFEDKTWRFISCCFLLWQLLKTTQASYDVPYLESELPEGRDRSLRFEDSSLPQQQQQYVYKLDQV